MVTVINMLGNLSSRPIQPQDMRNSWLATIEEIGLQKPYAKSKSGTNLVTYDVH